MFSHLPSFARSGAVALIALASMQAEAIAGPIGPMPNPGLSDTRDVRVLPVAMGEGRDHGPGYQIWRRNGGNWGGGRNWNGHGNWNGDGGGRHWRRGHWGGDNWGPGFALGLGLGLPLGYYGGYGGYDGYYGGYDGYYDEPVYRPRVYRRGYHDSYRYNYRGSYDQDRRNHCDNAYLTGPSFFKCDR